MAIKSGFKAATVNADTSELASKPEVLSEDTTRYSRIELYAPKTGDGVTGNTEAIWIGGDGTSADIDYEAGVDLHPGDSYVFENAALNEIYIAATTDGDKVTWIAFT